MYTERVLVGGRHQPLEARKGRSVLLCVPLWGFAWIGLMTRSLV